MRLADKYRCTGCSACYAVCPRDAIRMTTDQDGFYIPIVDVRMCTNCGLCGKTCPILNLGPQGKQGSEPLSCYGAKTTDSDSLMRSSSGGVFYEIAKHIIEVGGCVFGCKLDENLRAVHVMAKTLPEVNEMRGSKYVQSNLLNSFRECKNALEDGRFVLFVGTPCQIIGLRKYLNKEYKRLVAVDFICHGVPAPAVFEKYKKTIQKKTVSKIKSILFRDKCCSWKNFSMRFCFENPKEDYVESLTQNVYFRAFLGNYCLRESCYRCICKPVRGYADLTISDFWGIEDSHAEFFDEKGVSSIIVHSSLGNEIISRIQSRMTLQKVDLSEIEAENPSYRMSVCRPEGRDAFMRRYKQHGILSAIRGPFVFWLIRGVMRRFLRIVK